MPERAATLAPMSAKYAAKKLFGEVAKLINTVASNAQAYHSVLRKTMLGIRTTEQRQTMPGQDIMLASVVRHPQTLICN